MANAISSIVLCKVPITPINQIDFKTIDEQKHYFYSTAKHTFPKCKYQARNSKIKVKGYVDTLINCNYGYYVNTYNGTTKTFYFWIVEKNFLARETTELTIQLDVFQTWFFDIKFTPCFIERQHVLNDEIGEHTIPEDFELGDYVTLRKKAVSCLQGKPCFFIGVTDSEESMGGIFGRTYSGFALKYYNYNDYDELSNYIKDLCDKGKADSIAFIFTFPQGMIDSDFTSGETFAGLQGAEHKIETFNWDDQVHNFSFNGKEYIPFNRKLYVYPYNFITIKNPSGGNVILKLENSNFINDIRFVIEAVITQNPTITMTPLNYDGKSFAIDDSISLNEYGLCSWNNDNYSNWFAQHQNSINAQSSNAVNNVKGNSQVNSNNYNNALQNRNTNAEKGIINNAINTATALGRLNLLGAVGSAVGGGANTFLDFNQATRNANNDLKNRELMNNINYENQIRSVMASVKDAQVQPNTCKGSTAGCGLDLARDTATFFIEQTSIKPEYAKMIDMYFQMYGYKVNSVDTPNFRTRERWNYIKTINCNCYGDIPQDDIQELNDMINNGLTVWHSKDYLYNYNIQNNIL